MPIKPDCLRMIDDCHFYFLAGGIYLRVKPSRSFILQKCSIRNSAFTLNNINRDAKVFHSRNT